MPPRHGLSPPHKRPSDQWDRDDLSKRSRSGDQSDYYFPGTTGMTPREERRSPVDFDAASRYPNRPGSPSTATRSARALPSPSSMAYPPSTAATTVQSAVSPSMSYAPASATSATSAHIADLQHQVTLKTLALQTLQTEYASLLQRLQRERVKSQAIEKKTSVADRELEDLTQRNEDLADQVRTLETQLEESDRKREAERAAAAKEKEQWGRMLDMGGRLHAKGAEERQRLIEEKTKLARRVALYEGEDTQRFDQIQQDLLTRTGGSGSGQEASRPSGADGSRGSLAMRREVARLNTRVDQLVAALKEVTHRSVEMENRARDMAQQNSDVRRIVERAIAEEDISTTTTTTIALPAGTVAPTAEITNSTPLATSQHAYSPSVWAASTIPAAPAYDARTEPPTAADLVGFDLAAA